MFRSNDTINRKYLFIFITAGLFNNFLEALKMYKNSDIVKNTKENPYIKLFQYGLVWTYTSSIFCGYIAIVFIDIGFAFIYYIFLFESVWRKIYQLTYFRFGPVYILQFLISTYLALSFGYECRNLFKNAIFSYLKFLGASKKIILAYVVRKICRSLQGAIYIHILFSIFFYAVPDYVPYAIRNVPKIMISIGLMIFIFDRKKGDENYYRKIISVMLWGALNYLYISGSISTLVTSTDIEVNPRHITISIIISIYIFFSCLDIYFSGSGLKTFLRDRPKPPIIRLERS